MHFLGLRVLYLRADPELFLLVFKVFVLGPLVSHMTPNFVSSVSPGNVIEMQILRPPRLGD